MPLTPGQANRIPIQAERTAALILHAYGDTKVLPPEHETVDFSLRAKYELNRLPEIHRDIINQGETNVYRAYSRADRLVTIEGRLYFDALRKGEEPPFNMPFMAQREFNNNQEQASSIAQEFFTKHYLSETAAFQCARDLLRYRETNGQDPSPDQMDKMVEIAKYLETKGYNRHSYGDDSGERNFLCNRERELLFRYGPSYDTSRDLDQSKVQVDKSLERIQQQRQMEQQRVHEKQMDLGL